MVNGLNIQKTNKMDIMNSKDTQKIISNVYYYTYTTLSVVFILGMLGGIFSGDVIPALEIGIIGMMINPRTEEYIRIHHSKYPRFANVLILIVGLILFGILL